VPILDGIFVPNFVLTAAEQVVNWALLNREIQTRRLLLERQAGPPARRLALSIALYGTPHQGQHAQLEQRLAAGLARTARVGHAEARREVRELRTQSVSPYALAYSIPDAGEYGRAARGGLESVFLLIRRRARETAAAIAAAAAAETSETDPMLRAVSVTAAAARTLHNHVLELVGETLNMGRTAGVLTMQQPPSFALRSEQLDKNTCDSCTRLHGTIVQVDTAEYYELLPPSGCFGGGRCRGLMIFGDEPTQVRLPLEEAA
jgi:hypothetical protein